MAVYRENSTFLNGLQSFESIAFGVIEIEVIDFCKTGEK